MTSATAVTQFGNALLDAPVDPIVPNIIGDASDLVQEYLTQNKTWAQQSITAATAAITALSHATFPSALPDPPEAPTIDIDFASGASLAFDDPNVGDLTVRPTPEFNPASITIPDIASEIPTYVPIVTGLVVPDAPPYVAPDKPTAPALNLDFVEPAEPTADYGTLDALDELNLPTYTPVVLPSFNEITPTFDTLPPNPFIQWQEPEYDSDVRDSIESVLATMLAGGTGLPAAVENAIWDRGRDRETREAAALYIAADEEMSSKGFMYPPGRLNGQRIAIRDASDRKINELSREVMVKQADLEQVNRNFAVTAGINFEQVFVTLFIAVVGRNFEIAKFEVETQIQIYNTEVSAFNVEQQIFASKISLYRAQLEGAFAQIKAFQALVDAEKAKAEINVAKVQAFEAKIRAFVAQVTAFSELIKAQVAKAEFEKNKVDIFKAQIEAEVAEISGQKAQFDAYGSRIQGIVAQSNLEEANARAYAARVQAIGEKGTLLIKQADANIQVNRLSLEWNVALLQRLSTQSSQELTAIQARLAAFQASSTRGVAQFEAQSRAHQVEMTGRIEATRLIISRYQVMSDQWKSRSQEVIQLAEINSRGLQAAGQMAATLGAGAMAGTHVSAGISGSASASQSSSRAASDSTSRNQSYAESFSTSFPHKPV